METYDEWLESLEERAEEYQRILREWDLACQKTFMAVYLCFQDHGLVAPYYDPLTLCASEGETWEVFQ